MIISTLFDDVVIGAKHSFVLAVVIGAVCLKPETVFASEPTEYLSPSVQGSLGNGGTLLVACATDKQVVAVDSESGEIVHAYSLPGSPSGVVLSKNRDALFVTCAAPESMLCIVDITNGGISGTIALGHSSCSPVLSGDGKTLFVCNRFNNEVAFVDLTAQKVVRRVPVVREPVALALTSDDRFLLVANHLPSGRADRGEVRAVVSVVDVVAGHAVSEIPLPAGSGSVNDIRISPDGTVACVSHTLSRFNLPASQIEQGWINASALTLIDLGSKTAINTVLLDQINRGAANPWGMGWSTDGKKLCVTHAGTHELSVIDFPGLLDRLRKLNSIRSGSTEYVASSRIASDVPSDLTFLVGLRERIKVGGQGPRSVLCAAGYAYVANYFSDDVSVISLGTSPRLIRTITLGPNVPVSNLRKGEMLFHDATISYQGWQSCSSCHPGGARVDGMNWDLLNDGLGNPKNTKSLLLSHKTPPSMSLGVRENAEAAVRAGIKNILFTTQPDEIAAAIDEYLKSLQPVPSPYLVKGKLSPAAERGQGVFTQAGCTSCHPPGLFTNLRQYDVGTRGLGDKPTDRFDTPTLVELWRTAPYLNDGSALTVREVVTSRNPHDEHGVTSTLSPKEIDDLCDYLLSL